MIRLDDITLLHDKLHVARYLVTYWCARIRSDNNRIFRNLDYSIKWSDEWMSLTVGCREDITDFYV